MLDNREDVTFPLKVKVDPDVDRDGVVVTPFDEKELRAMMARNGWSVDPGTGKAVLTASGAEVLNPLPMAPPIGYVKEKSVMETLAELLESRRRLAQLYDSDVIEETVQEAEDFDGPEFADPDEVVPRSIYEISLIPEVPALPRGGAAGEETQEADTQVDTGRPVPDGNERK